MLTEVTPQFKYYFCLHANETMNRLEQTPKLVITALNRHCVGGGLEIAAPGEAAVGTALRLPWDRGAFRLVGKICRSS
jgi:enoyl-CoA hydratase/carnithine racemase